MPSPDLRRLLAFVTTLATGFAVGTCAVLVAPGTASADPAAPEALLSASDGSNTVRFASGRALTMSEPVKEVAWAPDGSEGVYVSAAGQLRRFRYDAPRNPLADEPDTSGATYAVPGYWKYGLGLIMSVKPAAAEPWRIAVTRNPTKEAPWVQHFVPPAADRHYLNPDATGVRWGFVYQVQPNDAGRLVGEPSVGLWDYAGGRRTIVDNAANPAISPDGTRLAFVRFDGSHHQIYVCDLLGGNLVQVTSNPVDHDHPVWSPSGAQLAFGEGNAVAVARPDGTGHAVVPGLSGIPAYQPQRTESVLRLAGADRLGTAVAVSRAHWAGTDGTPAAGARAQSVVLARSDTFADALGGTVLAAAKQGPLLLTPPGALDPAVRAEMTRILAPDSTVYLLGSPGALSTAVESAVRDAGYRVRRLAGPDRYSTAVAIADEIDPTPGTIFAATGADFPDALAAGAVAGAYNQPGSEGGQGTVLVLTNDSTLPAATRDYLDRQDISRWGLHTIGRQASLALVERAGRQVIGSDRYETAQLVAAWYFDGIDVTNGRDAVGVATGTNWPDALAGAALLGTLRAPLLLTVGNATALSAPAQGYLDTYRAAISTGYVFGSAPVVTPALADEIGRRISGPGGYRLDDGAAGAGAGGTSASAGAASTGAGGAGTAGNRFRSN